MGAYGMWISCDKKTIMSVNGIDYPITNCSAPYSPNKLILEQNGQIYDFSMDFPALNRNEVKSIKITEPEISKGWFFTLEL